MPRHRPRPAPLWQPAGRSPTDGRLALRPAPPDDQPLVLPAAWIPPSRGGVPALAALVPVLGAVALWLVTGSILSLWLALLGPLIAGATMLDGARSARRDRRRAARDADVARERIIVAVRRRHDEERGRLRATHPDVAQYSVHDEEVWRAVPARSDEIVVGSGARASGVRVTGGDGDEASGAVRAFAAVLPNAPITVPVRAGIGVVGRSPIAPAVVRALVVQLCSALPPGRLRLVGPLRGENAWAEALPHRHSAHGIALALIGPEETAPADAEIVIARTRAPAPAICAAVLTVTSPTCAELDFAGEVIAVDVEGIGEAQATHIARDLARRAQTAQGSGTTGPVLLGSLLPAHPVSDREGLSAVVGAHSGAPVAVDLVTDGPHAVVAGVTGAGKSELLITWILALCAAHSTDDVNFLLADFKGGTAFDALATLPHVTGVITDLDGTGARRALESLRAEVRWREGVLADVGARDIRDPRVNIPRLVIVVDEFAALLGSHPELQAVFTDVAARGRALGMHLILGTQRVAGVIREALLTNCPLRLSLRVIDEADSRAVVGTPGAARLPGGSDGRGLALVRRAGDLSPQSVRIALSTPADLEAVSARTTGPRPRRPWLPDLPTVVTQQELRARARDEDGILLGLIDEPEHQRQRVAVLGPGDRGLLVVGAAGTGRSGVLGAIAAQSSDEVFAIASDAEQAWDALARLVEHPVPRGSIVTIDDLDALVGRFPPEYSQLVLERIEHLIRGAGETGAIVVVSVRRLTGAVGRVVELLPRRALLSMPSRVDHIGAGGDPAHYLEDPPPGRGRLDGRAIQFAWTPVYSAQAAAPEEDAPWMPSAPLTGLVARRSAMTRSVLAWWEDAGARVVRLDAARSDGASLIDAAPDGIPLVVVGEPDEWQRQWSVLARIRGEHDLVIDAACGQEYRLVAGDREPPPYCESGRRRAWLRTEDAAPVRITLPGPNT